ncbi:MAG: exodeoxyribonuclease VII small subunit [Legionellales bacterium]|nr:exodeoxyribonuclease VII small subunit [Legionellales bacterium]
MQKKTDSINFEKSLIELEKLIKIMEKGDLSLEDSLKHFERGISLTRTCQQALSEAEQKVSVLLEKSKNAKLESFNQNDNEE